MKIENVVIIIVILAAVGIVYINLDREELAPLKKALDTGIEGGLYYINLLIDGFADLFSPITSKTVMKGEYVNTGDLEMTINECELVDSVFAEDGAAYLLILIDMRLYYLDDVIRPKKSWRVPGGRTHYDPLTTDKIYPNITKEGWVCFEVPKDMNLSEAVVSARCEGRRIKWMGG